ncbi:MAG: transposase [Candidatus Aenigmatarchaeota archaeon]
MEFIELSDFEWSLISSFLPPKPCRGRKAFVDDRMLLNGILYVLITGCRWMDMPRKYGSYKTAWKRLKKWQEKGIWDKIFKSLALMRSYDRVCVDSTTIEAKKGEN